MSVQNTSKLTKYITNLVIGIKYNSNYGLIDKWGEIVDEVLYTNNGYFDSKFFQRALTERSLDKIILNPQTDDHFRITNTDLIFKYKLKNVFKEDYEWFKNCIKKFIIDKIIIKYKIKNIMRIGIVYTHEFETHDINNALIRKIINENFNRPSDLRMSIRFPASESQYKKEINKYINTILSIGSIENDDNMKKFLISYDYQFIFDPVIEDIRQFSGDIDNKFFNKSFKSLDENVYFNIGDV